MLTRNDLGRAWNAARNTALANPADEFAQDCAQGAALRFADALGHGGCVGLFYDAVTPLTCSCGSVLAPEAVAV